MSWTKKLIAKLKDKAYRDSYVASHVSIGIPYQIKALREQRNWTQQQLGQKAGKPQNVISRLEDPTYGKQTLATLLKLAVAFDVALLVKFVPYSEFLEAVSDVSPAGLRVSSFPEEVAYLERAATSPDASMVRAGATQSRFITVEDTGSNYEEARFAMPTAQLGEIAGYIRAVLTPDSPPRMSVPQIIHATNTWRGDYVRAR